MLLFIKRGQLDTGKRQQMTQLFVISRTNTLVPLVVIRPPVVSDQPTATFPPRDLFLIWTSGGNQNGDMTWPCLSQTIKETRWVVKALMGEYTYQVFITVS